MAGDWIAAALLAAQAATIGESCSDADLVSFAKCAHGRALIQQADVEEGLAKLDEAMLPAIAGELTPIVTGLIYCQLIAACRQIYAFDRSREWTEALGRWCGAQPQMVQFNGICRVHRAELLEMSGSWRDAIAEARSAAVSAARAIGDETIAGATYQEAEIRRLRGEYALAEESYLRASRLGLDPQPGLALLRLAQGDGAQAAASIRRALAATTEPLARTRILPASVEILQAIGAMEDARQACQQLEEIASRFASDILRAMAAQARGRVRTHRRQPCRGPQLLPDGNFDLARGWGALHRSQPPYALRHGLPGAFRRGGSPARIRSRPCGLRRAWRDARRRPARAAYVQGGSAAEGFANAPRTRGAGPRRQGRDQPPDRRRAWSERKDRRSPC